MVTKVKCGTKGCKLEGQAVSVATLFLNKIASLDGPFTCPECGEPMAVALRVPDSYKSGAGTKRMPRRQTTTSRPAAKKPVGKKKVKKVTAFKGMGTKLGIRFKGSAAKKAGPRKRGPSKS